MDIILRKPQVALELFRCKSKETSYFKAFQFLIYPQLGFAEAMQHFLCHQVRFSCLSSCGSSSGPVSRNPFVETALTYALNYISSEAGPSVLRPARITILADSDYYSQPGTVSSKSTAGSRQFLEFGVRLQDAHKTGLGSSAALVTAFTGAVLCHYLGSQFAISSEKGKTVLHNLAQAAHCAAQGKVGSGFDIAAAVYGTCIYRRFSPSILSVLGEPASGNFAERLRSIVEDTDSEHKWDVEVKKKKDVQIPEGMALVMCDVDCGSETVGMVKRVLEWRKQDPPGSKTIWDQLQGENERLARRLLSGTPAALTESFSAIRAHIRDMGNKSGVPIEPPEQTALLDAIISGVDGVYGGVVPGAGGYDAIVLLVKDDEETLHRLRSFLQKWSASKQGNVKLLGVKGEMEGVRIEDERTYQAWVK
jgi:phosphomevalonate kinase